ncbi:Uncharacterised protein [Flavobacterium hibernum]|nr:Uncharacterised protein [Flavobacterium hibernum]
MPLATLILTLILAIKYIRVSKEFNLWQSMTFQL